ncbi:MAG: PSD1 and planctomycete cytochrome C domain-containing protein [Planctomycetota bacterium]|nr:PSD1 and planctomycete cytochrome C domain-containing protein [Planctomycetota bacterium]
MQLIALPARFVSTSGMGKSIIYSGLLVTILLGLNSVSAAAPAKVDFNRDIRPILSNRCFACHGPDSASREADLRLDREEDARRVLTAAKPEGTEPKSGDKHSGEIELLRRVLSKDPDERMPPPELSKDLTAAEIDLLRHWIDEGAVWSLPWSYVPPVKVAAPEVKDPAWSKNTIDRFIAARLEKEGLKPSPAADKVTLIRRLSIDLTGLPPKPAEVDAFVADNSDDAYEKLVDRLLASPHYGERIAMYWLDLVRYADTVGYHGDQEHRIFPYRDYVINALNRNLPFDQFTKEQLAGDLLPDPTLEQKLATGYNRVLQTTHEGGLQEKEYLAIYGADRVRNLSAVWMGGTLGCAQCHDHKFDPYTAKDFYSIQAFFADIDEAQHLKRGADRSPTLRAPELELPTEEQSKNIAQITQRYEDLVAQAEAEKKAAEKAAADAQPPKKDQPDAVAVTADGSDTTKSEAATPATPAPSESVGADGAPLIGQPATEAATPAVASPENGVAKLPFKLSKEERLQRAVKGGKGKYKGKTGEQIQQTRTELLAALESMDRCMITIAIAPRTIRILPRGDWMNDSGEVVEPAIPAFLGKLETGGKRPTRLDLANWLTDSKNGAGGLTAHVMANRFWYLMMGSGLSSSLDDFGGQGQPPVHPELLDALAIEFVGSGWDIKHLLKTIVMSETYRQSSAATPELRQRDPNNQLYARQSRFRYPAETVRDTTLAISGLLNLDVGGASAKPYQPAGYYRHLNFPVREYQMHKDDRQWRRGVYVHWQRQYLHPMLKAFDAPSREECTAERPKSNTPLAALVLLNDPTFVEAARVFAARILKNGGSSAQERLDFAFRQAVSREATPEERKLLSKLLKDSKTYYHEHAEASKELLSIGLTPVAKIANPARLAAWTVVARAILSKDETLTRE